MTANTLVVALHGVVAGTLTRTRTGLRFEYADAYRHDPSATPLSVAMPLAVEAHTHATVGPWVRGLLPDDLEVLRRWARHFDVRGTAPFDLLAAPIGEDCAGAVQLAKPERIDEVLARPGSVHWLSEADLADRLATLRTDGASWLGPDFTGQWSLAGHQPKTALRHEDGRWGDPRGAAATTHILKPAIAGLNDHDLNEHLCLGAARRAGLVVARTGLDRFGDHSAVVVERYDRRWEAGDVVRVHQEDVCQALGVLPDGKYESDGGPSARDVVTLLRSAIPAGAAEDATWRFFDALAWNWIIAGTDAHAKNYSLLLSGDQVRLAPMYDVASALPYGFHPPKLHLAMKIGGEYQLSIIEKRHWVRQAKVASLDPDAVLARVHALAHRAPDAFSDVASAPEIRALDSPLTARLVDAVTARAQECRRLLS
ncbi:MAG: type II toxin-antitoxin system HipA family toxin [Actinobacteria bacterium]|nr:type II toxin-antitoxin system HipA family toxin [Actinomycetota bacterium]